MRQITKTADEINLSYLSFPKHNRPSLTIFPHDKLMESVMSAQQIFLYPALIIYEFLLSLFGVHSLSYGIDLLSQIAIAILFWVKVFKILAAIIRRITGFEAVQ